MKNSFKNNIKKPCVLMFGPNRMTKSGISNVVNNWFENGIGEIADVDYISTLEDYVPGQYPVKTWDAVRAYFYLIVKSRHKKDIAHIHMSSYMSFFRKWLIIKYSKWTGLKTVIHLHGSEFNLFFDSSNNFIKRMIADAFDDADAVIVLSKSWKEFVQNFSKNPHIYILYNGSSLSKFSGRNNSNNKTTVLFMGRLGKRKGTYDLLPAFGRAIEKIPDLHLILGGDGDVDEVRKMVSEMGLQEHVTVPGWISGDEKARIFKSCDIYVLPSYNEGLPGSILEAMAVGVPIISTPVGGIPEAVLENRNGFLINPGDVDTLYEKIVALGQNKDLRETMGMESQKIIKEKFEIKSIVGRLGEIYGEVVKR